MKTLIDDLDFKSLHKYKSRSLVAWVKRNTGTTQQQQIVKETLEKRSKEVLNRLNDRIQVNYRLSESTSNKVKDICKKLKVFKTIAYLNRDVLTVKNDPDSVTPTELIKVIVECQVEHLWNLTYES